MKKNRHTLRDLDKRSRRKSKWTEFENVFYLNLRFKSFPNPYIIGGTRIIAAIGDAGVQHIKHLTCGTCGCVFTDGKGDPTPWRAFILKSVKHIEDEMRYGHGCSWDNVCRFATKEEACKVCEELVKQSKERGIPWQEVLKQNARSQASATASPQTQTSGSAVSPAAR